LRASIILGAAAILAAVGGGAQAQDASGGDSLRLVCTGTDATLLAMPDTSSSRQYYSGGMGLGEGRTAAQLGVAVENGQVRVRPPKSSTPLFSKKSKDGWYDLADVNVDRLAIKGRLKFNRIDRATLNVDRRTGEATFGDFSGLCRVVSTSPEATKF
jgi:hypothetical protein